VVGLFPAGKIRFIFFPSVFSDTVSVNLELEQGQSVEYLHETTERIAANELKEVLETYPGVFDVTNPFNSGRPEIPYSITPEGQAADFTKRDLAIGVGDAFFGREAQRMQRGSLETLRNMRIRKDDGATVPFSLIANTQYSASVDKGVTSPGDINARLGKEFFPEMIARHPGISIGESGQVEERTRSMKSLVTGFGFSIVFIYVLIAIPLRSYVQPLMIMSVIPSGIIGAILGHIVIGIPVSILSLFGVLALSGVVVNDSLVLVCHINDLRQDKDTTLIQACRIAGANRFRAIFLVIARDVGNLGGRYLGREALVD